MRGVLRKDEITMKTFTMDLFLLEQLKELEGEEKTGVRLVDAEESMEKTRPPGNIEGLNPRGGVKRIVVDEKETNVFLVSKPGVYSTLIASER